LDLCTALREVVLEATKPTRRAVGFERHVVQLFLQLLYDGHEFSSPTERGADAGVRTGTPTPLLS
jgi:hypothetical protein